MTVGPDSLSDPDNLPFAYDHPVTAGDLYRVLNELVRPAMLATFQPLFGLVTAVTPGPPKTVTVNDQFSGATVVARYDSRLAPIAGTTVVYGLRNAKQAVAIGSLA